MDKGGSVRPLFRRRADAPDAVHRGADHRRGDAQSAPCGGCWWPRAWRPKGCRRSRPRTWSSGPGLPRSVGRGPVASPPCSARTEQLCPRPRPRTRPRVPGAPSRSRRQDLAQPGRAAPVVSGPQPGPRHALATEEAQRRDDPDRRHGWPTSPKRPVLDPIDDPCHQPPDPCSPPGAQGTGTDQRPTGCERSTHEPGCWKRRLSLSSRDGFSPVRAAGRRAQPAPRRAQPRCPGAGRCRAGRCCPR